MKTARLTLMVVLGASLAGIAPAAANKDLEVINFVAMYRNPDDTYDKGYDYPFGDWQNKNVVQVPGKGLIVNLVGSKGGVGENRGLDFRKHAKARIAFVVGNRNKAKSFQFSLVDKDGTDQSFDVALETLPPGVTQTHTIDLTKPSREDKPGSTPGLNLKKLKSWQLKGNFQDEPSELLFLRVDAVE